MSDKKGKESLLKAVKIDCESGENCFNENGCDHEFTRIVPQDNPKLVEMGFKTACKRISKCTHKYCDKYKWVTDRAKLFSEKTGKPVNDILELWESQRTYWYLNYYQEGNFPMHGKGHSSTGLKELQANLATLNNDLKDYKTSVSAFSPSYSSSVKKHLTNKVSDLESVIKKYKSRISLYEMMLSFNESNN